MNNTEAVLVSTNPLLKGNEPVHLTLVQQFLLPYLPYMEAFWWMVFFCTLLYLSLEYVAKPLWHRSGGPRA
ncbi:MAG: hypothetical protein KBE09_04040 [Candidatus Pacebacteria bacterium]|nr:hypothetical protein [Candidatus Paceibacterota bacterium]